MKHGAEESGAAASEKQAAGCAPIEDGARQHRHDTGAGGTDRPRRLSPEKVGEAAAAIAFALLDGKHDTDAALASWAAIGSAMPLALDLMKDSIERRRMVTA